MRCLSCNVILTDFEATRKSAHSLEYIDMCSRCFHTINEDIPTIDRTDLEQEQEHYDDDDNNSYLDIDLDMDSE